MTRIAIILFTPLLLLLACSNETTADNDAQRKGKGRGDQLFNMHCTLCHGKDGKLGLNGAKDLTTSALTKEQMIAQVTNGKGAMMAYKNVLSAAEIEAVVAHVRSLRQQ
jgi:cytochrome c6